MSLLFGRLLYNPAAIGILKKLLNFLIPISFIIIVVTFVRFDKVFQFYFDEGVYLMRAYLHVKGYALYKDVWMDQPPLLVIMISYLFRIFGPSAYIARFLVLTFSALLLWAVYQIISRTQNILSALWAVGLIILSSFYVKLSVATMGSVPSIALAILSIYGVFLYQESHKKRYLVLSGVFLSFALLMRFFAAIFLPAIIYAIVMIEKKRTAKASFAARFVRACAWWFGALLAVFLYTAFVATRIDFSQLVQPYLLGRGVRSHVNQSLLLWLIKEYDVVLLVIGVFILLRRMKKEFFLVPFISLVTGMLIFCVHRPIWLYHGLYIFIPLCWLSSFGLYALCKQIKIARENKSKQLGARDIVVSSFFCCALILSVARIPSKIDRIRQQFQQTMPSHYHVVALMKQYGKQTHLVVTDYPIVAFYAEMPVPPYLASSSIKRTLSGLLKTEDYLDIIRREQPELILFGRYPWLRDAIVPRIQKDYALEYEGPNGKPMLYVLKRIKDKSLRDKR